MVTRQITFEVTQSGPLPDPLTLARYDQVLPGLAETLVEQMTTQSAHRRHLERVSVESANRRAFHGLYIGGALLVLLMVFGGFAILNGFTGEGLALVIASIAGGIGATVRAQAQRKNDLNSKETNVPRFLPPQQ